MRLYQPEVHHVAFTPSPATGLPFESVLVEGDSAAVRGVCYSPRAYRLDAHGNWAAPLDVREMAETFLKWYRKLSYRHERDLSTADAELLDSSIRADGSWVLTTRVKSHQLLDEIRSWSGGGYSISLTHRPITLAEEQELAFEAEAIAREALRTAELAKKALANGDLSEDTAAQIVNAAAAASEIAVAAAAEAGEV